MLDPAEPVDTLREQLGVYERWEHASAKAFWLSVLLFVAYVTADGAIAYLHVQPEGNLGIFKEITLALFVIATVVTIVTSAWARYGLAPQVDQDRVRQRVADWRMLSTFEGIERSEGYYSSKLPAGDQRLLASLHESCFHKLSLYGPEVATTAATTLVALLLALGSLYWGKVKVIELCWIVLLFSEAVGGKLVRVVAMHVAYRRLLTSLGALAERYRDGEKPTLEVLLVLWIEYECTKARYALRVPGARHEGAKAAIRGKWRALAGRLDLLGEAP